MLARAGWAGTAATAGGVAEGEADTRSRSPSTGTTPPATGWTATPGTAGMGGMGDNTNGNMGDGVAGVASTCFDFGHGAPCPGA